MLYKKNQLPELPDSLFKDPTEEYRATPFWAWNCKLEKEELMRQIEIFKKMGFGGFHMHVRSGMATEYLGDEFMELIEACTDKAEAMEMLSWLYDEDRWPSGFAGGLVTKDEESRIRYLRLTTKPYDEEGADGEWKNEQNIAKRTCNGRLIGRFEIIVGDDGMLKSYRLLNDGDARNENTWFAYLEMPLNSPRYNGYTYVNTLDKRAIDKFIATTHEKYYAKIGDRFGKSVPAIFCDEPQHTFKQTLKLSTSRDDVCMPWTDDLDESFKAEYGVSIFENLPLLFWESRGFDESLRYKYHDHLAERFASAFGDNIGAWCNDHGLMLTGHVMKEPTLDSQTCAVGEAMRALRGFTLPGIDMLANRYELTTAKQASSIADQYGREGVLSELYGVTGWDFDFRGHKLQGDWQAALGVTVRVPHLAWVSMEGEAKRDYPASISYQSPWCEKYAYVEDHFARLNTALTRGKPAIHVGVIHPIESYWMNFGPADKTASKRQTLDQNFQSMTDWLLYGNIDFDYISEALLPTLCERGKNPLPVGQMEYDVVIVPGCETLRETTLERLAAFCDDGGRLIFLGEAPKYVDAVPSDAAQRLYAAAESIPFSKSALLDSLDSARDIKITNQNGTLTGGLMHRMKIDGDNRWLFVAECKQPYNNDISKNQDIIITLKGHYNAKLYDTLSGNISDIETELVGDTTVIRRKLWMHDSILIKLVPYTQKYVSEPNVKQELTPIKLSLDDGVRYTLSEPNALLLDMAEYSLDGEPFAPAEEILRIDTLLRVRLGWTPWGGSANQPWCIEQEPIAHRLTLKYSIHSEIELKGAQLALECPETAKVYFNGKAVSADVCGYYVDRSIKTINMPPIPRGDSVLTLVLPFGKRTAAERVYILGDFGVRVNGQRLTITERDRRIGFGSIVPQGLPFYSGKINYFLDVDTTSDKLEVRLPQYHAACYEVSVDGCAPKLGAFAPYKLCFDGLTPGRNTVCVTLYINRTNGFSHIHCADRRLSYASPSAWRTSGDSWTYEYVLTEEGLISAPVISEIK